MDIALSGMLFAHHNKKSCGQNCYLPSVKVPSISMENGGVLERAKMGISIYGEKE